MWSILGIFFKTALGTISEDLKEAYRAKQDAKTEQERIAAGERISILEARKTSILAAQSDPFERWVRIGFAFPVVVYQGKLLLWDKVLGLGSTDPLSPELQTFVAIVVGGYFVVDGIKRIWK